jgi:hypothetical protein
VWGDVHMFVGVYVQYMCRGLLGVYVQMCVGMYVCVRGCMYVKGDVCMCVWDECMCVWDECLCVGMNVRVCECIYIDTHWRNITGSAKGN